MLLPKKPYVVTPVYSTSGLTKIEVVDDKGNFYEFIATERRYINNVPVITGYSLGRIVSADKSNEITFDYSTVYKTSKSIVQTITLIDNWDKDGELPPTPVTDNGSMTYDESFNVARLTAINFDQGKIVFNLVSGSDLVSSIQVMNKQNELIQTIELNRSILNSFFDGIQAVNKLDNITYKDGNGVAIKKYGFEYNASVSNIDVRSCDWWGYYNGSSYREMIPRFTVPYINHYTNETSIQVGNPGITRAPYTEALKSGVLKKIIYPTGGNTEFVYESNKYFSNLDQTVKFGPGLRIYQIKTTDINGQTSIKTYKYGENEVGYGTLDLEPKVDYFFHTLQYAFSSALGLDPVSNAGTYRERIFSSDFNSEVKDIAMLPIVYTEVAEYQGVETNNIGKTVYRYSYSPEALLGGMESTPGDFPRYHVGTFNYWDNIQLNSQSVYKKAESLNGVKYQEKYRQNYTYSKNYEGQIDGLHVQRTYALPQYGWYNNQFGVYLEKANYTLVTNVLKTYGYSSYHIQLGYKNMSSTSETLYNDDGTQVTTSTSYEYNSKQLSSKTTKIGSDNIPVITNIKYPFDYTGNTVLSQMAGLNMLNYPIEQFELKNTTPIKSLRTNYFNYGSTSLPRIYQQTVDVQKGSNPYETRLSYNSYDSYGNPLCVSKDKDVHLSYVWDYNHAAPTAEVANAEPAEIAYTSFEADGNGNWTGVNMANISSGAPGGITGTKYYNLNTAGLSLNGLSATKEYTVSYWSKNGVYTVNGTSKVGWPKNIRTVTLNGNSWTCWEHRVSGVTTLTVSGTGVIDELRLCPSDAQMKTYTYRPLIGLSTVNDFNNRINFYNYDPFGRLQLIRDMNGNIIKTMTYQYQSTTP